MAQRTQFRKVLPVLQTALAISFGGWGLWQRITAISNSWLGWNSDLPYHVWPWPFKFAVIQNMPAFVVGLILSWPLEALFPGISDWIWLLFVPGLWYLIGWWLERTYANWSALKKPVRGPWLHISMVIIVSLVGALGSERFFGSYVAFLPFGFALWIALGIIVVVVGRLQKRILGTA